MATDFFENAILYRFFGRAGKKKLSSKWEWRLHFETVNSFWAMMREILAENK